MQHYPFDSRDALFCAVRYSEEQLKVGSGSAPPHGACAEADLVGLMFGPRHSISG